MRTIKTLIAPLAFFTTTACTVSSLDPTLEAIGEKSDFSSIASVDLCDAAAYFTYDAPSSSRDKARMLLTEVRKRGDITKSEFQSALTGDVELGMSDMGATCAWGLPSSEREYYLPDGRKYTKWKYEYGSYGFDYDYLEMINDIVVSIHTGL